MEELHTILIDASICLVNRKPRQYTMQLKQVQAALKAKKISATIQQLVDAFTAKKIDHKAPEVTLEILVETYEQYHQESAGALTTQTERGSGRSRAKQALQKFEEVPEEIPVEAVRNHDNFLDIDGAILKTAITQVAELNVQKAFAFPELVASETHRMLQEPETQQALSEVRERAATALQQTMFGFNPQV